MLQYLQSWFPGWGGWYGYAQQTYEGEPFEGLLTDPKEQWNPEDILGMEIKDFLFLFKAMNSTIVRYLLKVSRITSLFLSTTCLKLNNLLENLSTWCTCLFIAIYCIHLLPML